MARKTISNDRYRLVGTYERLRKCLLEQPEDGRLDKALSYWVLPTDRRLQSPFSTARCATFFRALWTS